MDGATMHMVANSLLECSICLQVFKDPVFFLVVTLSVYSVFRKLITSYVLSVKEIGLFPLLACKVFREILLRKLSSRLFPPFRNVL